MAKNLDFKGNKVEIVGLTTTGDFTILVVKKCVVS